MTIGDDRLLRITSDDVLRRGFEYPKDDFWADHVMLDIPNTVAGAVRHAQPQCRAMTIHDEIARKLFTSYRPVYEAAIERGMALIVALPPTFERLSFAEWRRLVVADPSE